MAVLSPSQVASYASKAGFRGNALNIIVAIAQAESGLNTAAKSPPNGDGSIDRGLYQINSKAHPDVSDSCAYDPSCSSAAAFRISSGGTNFRPWTTYTSGAYKKYLSNVSASTNTSTGKPINIAWINYPFFAGNNYVTTYKGANTDTPHYAIDVQTPFHTTITSLVNGTVKTAGFQPWGGEVFITPDAGSNNVPSGVQFYVYHLDTLSVKAGQHVTIGQTIGLSGGQNSGGAHPVSTEWSTGPHTHVGWFSKFINTQIGSRPYGPNINPYISWLKTNSKNLMTGTITEPNDSSVGSFGMPTFTSVLDQVHFTLTEHPGFYGMALALDEVEQFPGFINLSTSQWDVVGHIRSIGASVVDNFVPFFVRASIVGLGILIIAVLIIKVQSESATKLLPLAAEFL